LEQHLHIISFNIPYPPDHGGLIDPFHKLKPLQQAGILIHYHCFEYDRPKQDVLHTLCSTVDYYPRLPFYKGLQKNTPYIVATRRNQALEDRLLQDAYPILMEGVHCTGLLSDARFAGRVRQVRLHNAEYDYYAQLERSEHNIFKKWFYRRESRLLYPYEKKMCHTADWCWAVTEKDAELYRDQFGCKTVSWLAPFLPESWRVPSAGSTGSFCLYHGDLSVSSNEEAVAWLLTRVFHELAFPFVIAGKNPSRRLKAMAKKYPHACLVANPSEAEMNDMIAKAHIHVIPSMSSAGIKLKLLHSLFHGRHCITNAATVAGSCLEPVCHIAETPEAFREKITALYPVPFSKAEADARRRIRTEVYDNDANARKLVNGIFGVA